LTEEHKRLLAAIASRLTNARLAAGFQTRDDAAAAAKTDSSVYHRHEGGQLMPRLDMILRYAEAFDCSPGWLAFGERPVAVAAVKKPHKPLRYPARPWRGRWRDL
jgi:hypothetical protein